MIVFHVFVNIYTVPFRQELFYWVPVGFMLFLGVILGQFLSHTLKKTFLLGCKLLGIFLLLNIPAFVLKNPTCIQFLLGNQDIFSFEILFPMSLLCFLSIYFSAKIKSRYVLSGILFLLLLFIVIAQAYTWYSYNIFFLSYGVIGYCLGKGWNLHAMVQKISFAGIIALTLLCIFLFWVLSFTSAIALLTLLQVICLFIIISKVITNSSFLVMFGKNSLIFYIIHILLLGILKNFYVTDNSIIIGIIIFFLLFFCKAINNILSFRTRRKDVFSFLKKL